MKPCYAWHGSGGEHEAQNRVQPHRVGADLGKSATGGDDFSRRPMDAVIEQLKRQDSPAFLLSVRTLGALPYPLSQREVVRLRVEGHEDEAQRVKPAVDSTEAQRRAQAYQAREQTIEELLSRLAEFPACLREPLRPLAYHHDRLHLLESERTPDQYSSTPMLTCETCGDRLPLTQMWQRPADAPEGPEGWEPYYVLCLACYDTAMWLERLCTTS